VRHVDIEGRLVWAEERTSTKALRLSLLCSRKIRSVWLEQRKRGWERGTRTKNTGGWVTVIALLLNR